jgi:hypothetical protein
MVKTGKEAGEFVTPLPDSGNSLHKKNGKSFPIFAECTKNRWMRLNTHLANGG